jgi:hypothetical protein
VQETETLVVEFAMVTSYSYEKQFAFACLFVTFFKVVLSVVFPGVVIHSQILSFLQDEITTAKRTMVVM